MTEPKHILLARLSGDICTKGSQTRRTFIRRLKSNLKDALNRSRVDYTMRLSEARFDIVGSDPRLVEFAARVFGIHSVQPGRSYQWETLDDIIALGVKEFGAAVEGKRFAVRSRRSGNSMGIPFDSREIDRTLGSALFDRSAGVDLTNPEVTVRIDVRQQDVVFYEDSIRAPAGLPLGVEGRALALISGGFDSSVASHQMMSRGLDLDFVFFNLGGPPHEQGVIEVLRTLTDRWSYGARPVLHVVDFRPVVGEIKTKVKPRYWQVMLKRLMLRAAEKLSEDTDYLGLVTGDALGQVSSQTLHNLHAVSSPISMLILRPLVGMDKDEIVKLSRLVGTHDQSAHNPEYCALGAGRPTTRCTPGELDYSEDLIDMRILDQVVAHHRTERVDRLVDAVQVDVRVMGIEPGAMVLDLREEGGGDGWEYPGAVRFPYERALDSIVMLPKGPKYVLFCDVGLKSAFLAEVMRGEGWDASSFSGGLRALKRWADRQARESG